MRLEDGNGLDVIDKIHEIRPDCKMVMLTGYGNLATAVSAVQKGALSTTSLNQLMLMMFVKLYSQTKEKHLLRLRILCRLIELDGRHIQRVYELCGKNVSETARRLNMHRRTLQRILAKRAPR